VQIPWGDEQSSTPRRGRWSQAEIARFKDMFGLRDENSIARELNRSVASIRKMADTVFEGPVRTGPWEQAEIDRLKSYLGAAPNATVALILARPLAEVEVRIDELSKIKLTGRWTQEEISDLKRLYGTRTDNNLAVVFGRPVESIRSMATKLCIAKDKAFLRRGNKGEMSVQMPRWKEEELAILRESYPNTSNLDIAKQLDRSVKSVVSKAHNMKLKKDPERLREMGRENVSLRYKRRGS
jgi:hypothetical protein